MRWLRIFGRGAADRREMDEEWVRLWTEAAGAPDRSRAVVLRERLRARSAAEDDDSLEVAREMMDALDTLVDLVERVRDSGLPAVSTGHRAAAHEPCHFSAKVSLPDDPAHPAGTLLLTASRLVFVGGARGVTVPWHAVSACVRDGRDLLLGRVDRPETCRIRCNSFADALQAAFLAGQLSRRRA